MLQNATLGGAYSKPLLGVLVGGLDGWEGSIEFYKR